MRTTTLIRQAGTIGLLAAAVAASAPAATKGRVTFSGEPPPAAKLKMNADPKCQEIHGADEVELRQVAVGEDGGLADVFVYIADPPDGDYPTAAKPASLEQHGCLYEPRVQGVRADQTIRIVNGDDTLHNVRALARKNRPFNLGQPSEGVREKSFKLAENAIPIKCDVHPWMQAFIFVMPHPFFAVTDAAGQFSIEGLPAGTYELHAWHEKLGETSTQVTVDGQGNAEAALGYSAE